MGNKIYDKITINKNMLLYFIYKGVSAMNQEKRGNFLAKCRKEKKITQEELGLKLNYSRNNISKWERGESFPSNPDTLTALSSILEVSVEELLYGEKKNNNNEQKIIDNLVNEYKEKYYSYKKTSIKLFISILLIVIISFMLIYFVFIKGTISIYTLSLDNDEFSMQDSVLVLSNSVSTFYFNKIESKNNEKINKIKLYYYENNEERIIFSGDNDTYFIKEANGYAEYNLQNLKKFDLFLSVETEDENYKDIKIDISRSYTNDNIFPKKSNKIGNLENNEVNDYDFNYKEVLELEGFKTADNIYFSKQINDNAFISIEEQKIRLLIHNEKEDSIEYLDSIVNSEQILYTKTENGKEIDSNIIQVISEKNCIQEKCSTINDYASYIVYCKKLIN